ncbi:hypothetical protein PB01_03235 [Psychrobacillus glaciei]|uniref:Alpha-ribazole-5-phosphate synthase n=1 Tax=Psychrobacillus glaciei TaxID=2283160 RepID=A0A5J6SIV3_9BACI|nr:hypothetical protein [Psychrobacillus glaciei]QFF97906.1 hypothetical protein PB01_03235 [Psychrobacillus glaciei]
MRNAVLLPNGFVVTTDNSAAIGEKAADVVRVDDEVVAYFAARVALMEQWTAGAFPISIIVHNFSGNKSWEKYKAGIQKVFYELEQPCPEITGSTESNMETLQSAMAVTMIGERKKESNLVCKWYVYGKPCVGEEVLMDLEKIADIKKIWDGITSGLVKRIWPVGSAGIKEECQRLGLNCNLNDWDILKSAGPATSVVLGISPDRIIEAKVHFGKYFEEIN